MYIKRDTSQRLTESRSPEQLLIGPRQCRKSTLLSCISDDFLKEVTLDDLQLRTLANQDPALFLQKL